MDASEMSNDFRNDMNALKSMDKGSFFNFDRLIFPSIAKWLFILLSVLIAVVGICFFVAGFIGLFTTGFAAGLGIMVFAVIYTILSILLTRIWFELVLVMFKINEAVQDIRTNCKK